MNTLQSHVAILAFPVGSHAGPLYNLASKLAATQPATKFSFFTSAAVKASLSALISTSTPNLTVFTVHDGLPENPVPAPNPEERIVCFLKATPDNFLKGLESAGLPRIVLVVSDSFLCCGREIAVKMGVPWIAFWVSSPASLATHFHTQTIRDSLGFRNDDDSGATRHVCCDRSLFKSYEANSNDMKVYMRNSSTAQVAGTGTVIVELTSGKKLTMKNVLHAPDVRKNLISGSPMTKSAFRLVFENNTFICTKKGVFVGKGYECNGLFKLSINKESSAYIVESYYLWHNRLEHVHSRRIMKMMNLNLIPKQELKNEKCQICVQS